MRKKIESVTTKILNARFFYLFITIMLLFLSRTFLTGAKVLGFASDIILWAILISCVWAVHEKRKQQGIAMCMAVVSILADLMDLLLHTAVTSWASKITGALFICYVVVAILLYLARQEEVTTDMIMAAASEYVLIGILFGILYNVVDVAYPGSFSFSGSDRMGYLYFSFMTLTTTGYGDFLPLSPQARSLAALEALTGQLYIAITVALLVGAYAVSRKKH